MVTTNSCHHVMPATAKGESSWGPWVGCCRRSWGKGSSPPTRCDSATVKEIHVCTILRLCLPSQCQGGVFEPTENPTDAAYAASFQSRGQGGNRMVSEPKETNENGCMVASPRGCLALSCTH